MDYVEEFKSSSDGDSDRELQVAFEKGLLKAEGLNLAVNKVRPSINNKTGLTAKVTELKEGWYEKFDWPERLDVVVERPELAGDEHEQLAGPSFGSVLNLEDDDFRREISFYKQAQLAVAVALPKLRKLNVATKRPDDYFAEMAKSDKHMEKVKRKLLEVEQGKERSEAARRLRNEKKCAMKVQQEVLKNRQQEKRKMLEGVQRSRKGMKGQLEKVLEERRTYGDEEDDENGGRQQKFAGGAASQKRREHRDKKFGFGGRKKGKKRNTTDSFADGFEATGRKKAKQKVGKVVLGRERRQPKKAGGKKMKRKTKAAALM